MITFELLHGYTKAKRMTVRQKMANLELNIEFVIRAEMFILDKTNELLLASDWFINYGIGRSYVTACTCAEP